MESLQFALICVGGFVMTCTIGAVAAVVIDVIHTSLRATGAAMVALIQNLLGLAAGAFVTGALSDALGLQQALAIIPFICLVAAGFFIVAARSYEADLASVKGVPLRIDDSAAVSAIA